MTQIAGGERERERERERSQHHISGCIICFFFSVKNGRKEHNVSYTPVCSAINFLFFIPKLLNILYTRKYSIWICSSCVVSFHEYLLAVCYIVCCSEHLRIIFKNVLE
jgi:hypothetical protein